MCAKVRHPLAIAMARCPQVMEHGSRAAGFLIAIAANSKIRLTCRAGKRTRFSNRNTPGGSGSSLAVVIPSIRAIRARKARADFQDMPIRCFLAIVLLSLLPAFLPVRLGAAVARGAQSAADSSSAPSPELAQVKSLLDAGKIADAERITRDFLKTHSDSAEGHFLLGLILFREIQVHGADLSTRSYPAGGAEAKFRGDKAKESLAEFTEGARFHVPTPFDLKIVAFDYIMLSDYNDADKWLTRAVQMNPADADIWYNLARTKYSENRFAEAIQAFQQCLKLDPKNEKAENNLGLSLEGLGRTDEAIAAYKQAIAWQLDSAQKDNEPLLNLGSLLLDQGQPKEALAYLLQANSIPPDDAKVHERLGKAYSHLDQLAKAQAEFEKAIGLAPNVASLHFMLGQIYRREGMLDKAKAEFKRTDELNGTHSSDAIPHP